MEYVRVLEGSPEYIEAYREIIDSILKDKINHKENLLDCLNLDNIELKLEISTKDSKKLLKEVCDNENIVNLLLKLNDYNENMLKHSYRLAIYSTALTELLDLKEEKRATIYTNALLHDIGKIALPKDLWAKKTKLSEHDARLMRGHTKNGYRILKDINSDCALVALEHHERISGCGYPSQLEDKEIGYNSKIIAVLDVFDVMSTKRSYSLINYPLETTYRFFDLYSKKGKKKAAVKDEKLEMLIDFFKNEQLFDYDITQKFLELIPKPK